MFYALAKNGSLDFGEYNTKLLKEDVKKNEGARYKLERLTPESKEQRGFFEGAVVKLCAYYQEDLDYRKSGDCRKMREALKIAFNGEIVSLNGKLCKVAKSTRGELNRGFLDRIIDWMAEQGYQTELLMPDDYKRWRDTIFSFGGPPDYISYLKEIGKLK